MGTDDDQKPAAWQTEYGELISRYPMVEARERGIDAYGDG